jgi:hypothetical protein
LRRFLAGQLEQLESTIRRSAAQCGAERYRKHFDALGHTTLLLYHGLSGATSLRQSYSGISTCPGLLAQAGLLTADGEHLTVSYSQLAASNSSRPAAFLSGVLGALHAQVRALGPRRAGAPPADLCVIDSTFLHLSLALATWLPVRRNPRQSGVQVLVAYTPALDLPEHFLISDTRTNDVQRLDQAILDDPVELAALAGRTLAIDLGFYSHARFARLRQAGVSFVSRLHHQARVAVVAEHPIQATLDGLPAARIQVGREAAITLGSPNNRAGAVLTGLRLVTATVTPSARAARRGDAAVTYTLVTDRWDLAAAEVVQLYLWRWEIELFFRWLKRILGALKLIGTSRNAVELSVALAIVVHLLLVLAAAALALPPRSVRLLALLPGALAYLSAADRLPHTLPALQLPLPACRAGPDVTT